MDKGQYSFRSSGRAGTAECQAGNERASQCEENGDRECDQGRHAVKRTGQHVKVAEEEPDG